MNQDILDLFELITYLLFIGLGLGIVLGIPAFIILILLKIFGII